MLDPRQAVFYSSSISIMILVRSVLFVVVPPDTIISLIYLQGVQVC